MEAFYKEITTFSDIVPGNIVRRISADKDQQGRFIDTRVDGLLFADVVDISAPAFLAEVGIMRPLDGCKLYIVEKDFSLSENAEDARKLITDWILFRENVALQKEIKEFIETSYTPEQILHFQKIDEMKNIFIPVQQRFKIGRFMEKRDYKKERVDRFRNQLASLYDGKHLTYVAFIPKESSHDPMFYSIGTKPHLETLKVLEREPFAFRPNHGGHIKVMSGRDEEPKRFIVDAGSNDLGVGIRTTLSTAEMVTDALHDLYSEFEFTPVPGRDAYGIQQSY